ncbi:uncharacterized protein [Acropora muricata]|uniref:uncharacterized protein isoform X2 n=1 Tax=Acropora muricata TaxID=159855 RepID=UPI0034E5BE22
MRRKEFSFPKWVLFLVFLNSLCICQTQNCNDCCNINTPINETRRSINSIWEPGQIPLCDRLLPFGWYRFTSFGGSKMPETPVQDYHCGTHDPVWLRDPHPTTSEGNIERRACISSFGNTCRYSITINVTNCGSYFVYYLRPLYFCATAYCAGFGVPCPYGQEGESPNCYDPPVRFSSDNLGLPEITYVSLESNDVGSDYKAAFVTLLCKVAILNGIEKWKNVSYLIEWVAEGRILKNETACEVQVGRTHKKSCPDRDLTSQLPGENYTIGQSISCKVSAKFTTSPKNVWSPPKEVPQPFFAGLKVNSTALDINLHTDLDNCELQLYPITITPTIPVRKTVRGLPSLTFHTPKEAVILENCIVQLKQGIEPVQIKVKANCQQHGKVSVGLKPIVPRIWTRSSEFWSQETGLPTIWVNIRERTKIEQCLSSGDPHYYTLRPLSYGRSFDFMGRGDFILYKNSKRHFEVQTRQWSCGGTVTCNCGVVLRDHNDVIEFNCCNDHMKRDYTTPIRVKIRSKKCLSPGIVIKKLQSSVHNAKYQVMFPSGAKVEIQRTYWGLNVYLYTPRAKVASYESGLCIYPALGQDANSYGESLRLSPNESYFDILPRPVLAYTVDYSQACECTPSGGHPDCKNAFDIAFPTLKKTARRKSSPMFLCDRDKRDMHLSDELTDEDYHLFKRTLPSHKRRKRESGRISKENATYYCEARISKTKIGKLCAKIGINVQALVNTCSFDVEYTGDFSFALGGVEALVDQCGNLAALNLSRSSNSNGDDPVESPVPSLVEEIAESLCPNDCSSNGRCVNGSCICSKDFTADDCSAYIYEIPTIVSLQGNGLCDRRNRQCRKVTVLGSGFIPSENMTCHLEEVRVVSSKWSPNNTELKFPGVMTDLVLAECNLPESPVSQGYFHEVIPGTAAAGLKISVSNDGEHRSKETLTLISYDSACMSCNISSGCSLRENSCLINGYCFAPDESNPTDGCYQCLPGVNTSAWTRRQVNLSPKFSPAAQFYALYQEYLELPIKVVDPEGMPITVTLMDGSPSQAIIRDNVLLWNATSSPNTQFQLKATDACQAVSTLNITISLVVCPCQNNGKCIPHRESPRGSGLYQCNCVPGFTGDRCQTNINECQSYPCIRGRCIDELNNFSCICDPGYVGRTCDTDYDDCTSSPCVHGNCIDYTGSYSCTCNPGYTGQNCTIDINECASSPCRHGACVDQSNGYSCQCNAGYTGYDCTVEIDECQSLPCVHGTCKDIVNGFICSCEAGFSGVRCEEDIDDCQSSPCVNGICTDLVNNYTCSCVAGFTGRDCDIVVTTCTADSCFPNVTCSKKGQTIACGPCPLGFTGDGKICKDIEDCANHRCTNGASCVDGINSYSCNCTAGFSGVYCETGMCSTKEIDTTSSQQLSTSIITFALFLLNCSVDLDDCVNHNCSNGASCIDGINSYSCNCSAGFIGSNCETNIDDCVSHTCANGASCVDGINTYSCKCTAGFTGWNCDTDIDDCRNNTCTNGASCIDGINGYSCNCSVGFSGEHCENNLDDCVNHNCSNGASCIDGINSYSCNCSAGFTGSNCETDIDDCVSHTCANGASCVDGINTYSCKCAAGFTGWNCETDIDDCMSHVCANGGSCVDGIGSYTCKCTMGFTGKYCETDLPSLSSTISPKTDPSTEITASTTPNVAEYSYKIKLMETWNDELNDKNSDAFKDLKNVLEEEIMNKLRKTKNIIGVNVVSFSKGSIVAEFKLIYHTSDEPKEAFEMLKEKISDGNLGILRVDPSSLVRIPSTTTETTTKHPEKLPYAIIIAVSFGGLFVLVLCIICLSRFCKNRNAAHRGKRGSDNVPPEEAFPNSQSYELKSVAVNNAYVADGEVSGFSCDKQTTGFSNEVFH